MAKLVIPSSGPDDSQGQGLACTTYALVPAVRHRPRRAQHAEDPEDFNYPPETGVRCQGFGQNRERGKSPVALLGLGSYSAGKAEPSCIIS